MTNDLRLSTKSGFTLIELLVVIAIIGILATLTILSLNSAKQKARDATRLSDIRQMQTALELYYNDAGGYPTQITPGQSLVSPTSGVTYMTIIPSNPRPWNDGSCANSDFTYSTSTAGYSLNYCTANQVGAVAAGSYTASPGVLTGVVPVVAPCVATSTCSALSYVCGNYTDSCGAVNNCGTCLVGDDCAANQLSCTPDSNTKLLLHFDNNLTDSSVNNKTVTNYSTVDNSTYYKFGAHSRYFNGGTAYLTVPNSTDWSFGTGDFTIDFWQYSTNFIRYFGWAATQNNTNMTQAGWVVASDVPDTSNPASCNAGFFFEDGGVQYYFYTTGNLIVKNTWQHIAIVRYGNTVTAYINGTAAGSMDVTGRTINTYANATWVLDIGNARGNYASAYNMYGYIDEFRISKGIARWTATFTPPTLAY